MPLNGFRKVLDEPKNMKILNCSILIVFSIFLNFQFQANTRQWALVSLTRVFEAVGLLHVVKLKCLNRVIGALQTAIQDYATDQRGDVGSWVREVALESLAVFKKRSTRNSGFF